MEIRFAWDAKEKKRNRLRRGKRLQKKFMDNLGRFLPKKKKEEIEIDLFTAKWDCDCLVDFKVKK